MEIEDKIKGKEKKNYNNKTNITQHINSTSKYNKLYVNFVIPNTVYLDGVYVSIST